MPGPKAPLFLLHLQVLFNHVLQHMHYIITARISIIRQSSPTRTQFPQQQIQLLL
ncbi:hypothetical protein LguiB_007287 [Lonicera macranthoides]